MTKVRSDLANVDTICDMGSALDGDCVINMGIDDRERTNILGVNFFGCFVVKNESFLTWLVVVMTAFFVSLSKIVINDDLSSFLENVEVCDEWYVKEQGTIKNDGTRGHANGGTSCVQSSC
jgi:hypothetical protein